MRIILHQPDIPQNTGAILRLAACLGAEVAIIGPLGYTLDDRRLARAGMDYVQLLSWRFHPSWESFADTLRRGRLLAFTTKASRAYFDFPFEESDELLFGSESAGLPPFLHEAADDRLVIPMAAGARSLNLAMAVSIVLAEARRQLHYNRS
ncbi:MAG TPA: tRNA (cytidine(34)-2'-O)-methyltransferase [Dongiaceae bacterium]|jgi:tRNA (cytidine/uridine-2'-O-)-methyltransferase|nr:tRNA (cytidine(34)-2'-O)-methyltransferase [Dongiaceae bacterium]